MRLLVCLLISLILASCSAGSRGYYTQSVQSWRGGNVTQLTQAWGPPSMTMQNGANINYVYKQQSFYSSNATYSPSIGVDRDGRAAVVTTNPTINTPWNRGFAAYCLTVFTATPQGKIVDTNIQGSNCYVSQSKALGLANPKK